MKLLNSRLYVLLFIFGLVGADLSASQLSENVQDTGFKAQVAAQKLAVKHAQKGNVSSQSAEHAIPLSALNDYAINQGYGYKSANLMVVSGLAAQINNMVARAGLAINVAVPDFLPVSTGEINAFLQQAGINLNALWREFSQFKGEIKAAKMLTPKAQQWLQGLTRDIKNAFEKNNFSNAALINFIAQQRDAELFMVRSTGKEDTATFANAGGNESLPAKPDEESISHAIGEVIASYFGNKSLGQRIAAATANELDQLFTEDPFVPVLVQRMVGEQLEGIIVKGEQEVYLLPVSGVMFTQEAEGRTENVTQIQAAFGHGEGVVNSLVPVDTYFIGQSGIIHKVIRKKTGRMVPVFPAGERKVSVKQMQNHPVVAELPTLDNTMVQAFKIISDAIAQACGIPMDVEFIVDKKKSTIYLVQARPLVFKQGSTASYLVDVALLNNSLPCTTIGAAGGGLRTINSMNELVIAQTLADGLNQYLKSSSKDIIKAVITGTPAAATSHEATTLRGQGLPVILMPNLSGLAQLQPTVQNPLIIDVQREIIGLANAVNTVNGWFTHPIPLQASLYDDGIDEAHLRALLALQATEFKNLGLKELVEQLKDCTSADQLRAQQLLGTIMRKIAMAPKYLATLSEESQKEAKIIYRYVALCSQEILLALGNVQQKRDLGLLYAIKFLEAALFQPYNNDIVRGYSFFNVVRGVTSEVQAEQLLAGQKVTKPNLKEAKSNVSGAQLPVVVGSSFDAEKMRYIEPLAGGAKMALTKIQEKAWVSFIKGLQGEASLPEIQDFATKIAEIQKFDVFDLFLNTEFLKYQGSVQHKLQAFNMDYERSKRLLQNLYLRSNEMKNFDLSLWEDPKNFDKQWQKFQNILVYFMGIKEGEGRYAIPQFVIDFRKSGAIGKQAAISVMEQLVTLFDTSIKTVSGMQQYPLAEKVRRFAFMVREMFYLVKQWLESNLLQKPIVSSGNYNFWVNLLTQSTEKFFVEVVRSNEAAFLENQLQVNIKNNKPISVMYLDHKFGMQDVRPIYSVEEVFTIVHQSLLNIIGRLTAELVGKIIMPPNIARLMSELEKMEIIFKESIKATFLGISIRKQMVNLKYFIPLRVHSADISILYQKKLPITVRIKFTGDNFLDRWRQIERVMIEGFNMRYRGMQAAISELTTNGLTIEWNISQSQSIDWLPIVNVMRQICVVAYNISSSELEETIDAAGTARVPEYSPAVVRDFVNTIKRAFFRRPFNWITGKIYNLGSWFTGLFTRSRPATN